MTFNVPPMKPTSSSKFHGCFICQNFVPYSSTLQLGLRLICQHKFKNNRVVNLARIIVTRSEKSRLPHTQQQDTLFTIKR